MHKIFWSGFIGIIALISLLACSVATDKGDPFTVYLVRHAEKITDSSKDPALTPEGKARAQSLVRLLGDKGLLDIYSSNYIRTRSTASPLAAALGLDITLYDPRDLTGLAQTLKSKQRTALIVGHSNTTPALAQNLGANPGPPIIEATEYDRLYKIVIRHGEIVFEEIVRF